MSSTDARYQIVETRWGPAAIVGGRGGIRRVILPGMGKTAILKEVRGLHPEAVESSRGLRGACRALERYFETGRLPAAGIRVDLSTVSSFRRAVYEALRAVPAGETVTYSELARRIGRPGAHRSVGTALSRNPVPVFVPCHRVIRTDGGLGGFTAEGGLALKRGMLGLEARHPIC